VIIHVRKVLTDVHSVLMTVY